MLLRSAVIALLFLAGSLGVTLLVATALFGVAARDIPAVAALLFGVGGGGGLLALVSMRPAVLGRVGGVRAQLVGVGLISSLLFVGMIMAGAWAMFLSGHDLAILLTMLLFAALLAVGFGLRGAGLLARRVERVRAGTAQLTGGELETELPVEGRDEIAGLAEDFNRMARALAEAAVREREMEQARRDLIAAISHDLRTPLASARALIEAVVDGVAEEEAADRYLRSAQKEISHLGRLVDDLFELARIDAGMLKLDLEPASLHDLISDTISSLQPRARGQGVRLIGEVSCDVDPVLMNPPRLQRVLHNLLDNALHHTPADGMILLSAKPHGELIRVEVSDTGEGIVPDDLPRIFERSFRGERSRTRQGAEGGAGLGLAIARGLIEAHGGAISAESRAGEGACFCFTLRRT